MTSLEARVQKVANANGLKNFASEIPFAELFRVQNLYMDIYKDEISRKGIVMKYDMIDKNTTLTVSTDAGNSSWEGITYSFDNYNHTTGKPNSNTLYDQYKFSGRDQFYFIDDDGNLIVRFNETYTHTEPK